MSVSGDWIVMNDDSFQYQLFLTGQQRSSLVYQFLLYFNGWYMLLYMLAEVAIFIWKGML